jgi:putative transposase
LPFQATVTLDDVAAAIKEGLLALSCTAGLLVMEQMIQEELTAKVGPKGRHIPDRQAVRNGSAKGSVALGGRTVPVSRPRAVGTQGGEVALDTYGLFSSRDLLTQLTVERMLAGVATRRHAAVGEPVGEQIEAKARSTSKSSVSRRFKAATESALAELLARDLSELDVAVLMIDGIVFHECCCVVASWSRPTEPRSP